MHPRCDGAHAAAMLTFGRLGKIVQDASRAPG